MHTLVCAIALLLMLAVPPLSDEHRIALETAKDGESHLEGAFDALVRHTAAWESAHIGDAPVRLFFDVAAMIDDPEMYRGDLVLIEGRIERIEPLRMPFEGVTAWMIRLETGEPILVYMNFRPQGGDEPQKQFHPSQRVRVPARFYKYVERETLAGSTRRYAAFVGAFPEHATASGGFESLYLAAIVGLVILLAVVFAVVWVLARRASAGHGSVARMQRRTAGGDHAIDYDEPPADLPDDPAEALDALRRAGERQDHA